MTDMSVPTVSAPPAPEIAPCPAAIDEPSCLAIDSWTLWITITFVGVMWVLHLFQLFGVSGADLARIFFW
jgi:hypothetical protein